MARPGNTRLIKLFVNLFMARFSPADIDRLARTPLRIGLAGDGDLLRQFRQMVLLDRVPLEVPFPSLSLHPLPADNPDNHWHLLDDCQLVVVLMRREDLLGDLIYRVREALPRKVPAIWCAVGPIEPWLRYEISEIARELKIGTFVWLDELQGDLSTPLLREVLRGMGGYDLSAARKMPLFRDLVAARIMKRTSRQNLMIAMASALPTSLPWVGPIIGLLGVTAEIIFLTSNQLKMVLQIASVYDQEMDVHERVKEMLPVVAGAFGWRALSRELVGFVPAIGPGIKGSIAYAATMATGEAARWFYKTGTHMDPEERRRLYNDALEKASALTHKMGAILPSLGRKQRQALMESAELPAWGESLLGDDETPSSVATESQPTMPAAPGATATAGGPSTPLAVEEPAQPAVEEPAKSAIAEPAKPAVEEPTQSAVAPPASAPTASPPVSPSPSSISTPTAPTADTPTTPLSPRPTLAIRPSAPAPPAAPPKVGDTPTQEGAASSAESPAAAAPEAPRGRAPRPKIDIERNARARDRAKPPTPEEKKE